MAKKRVPKRTVKPRGDEIVRLRIAKGWSQEALLQEIDKASQRITDIRPIESKRTLSRIENGKPAYLSSLQAIAHVLGVPVHSLLKDRISGTARRRDAVSVASEERGGLTEYLFVDRRRLNSYLEQFELSGSGEATPDRPLTVHDGAVRFLRYLDEHQLAVTHLPRFPHNKIESLNRLRAETMVARRACIPLTSGPWARRAMYLWVSTRPEEIRANSRLKQVLVLIEDYQGQVEDASDLLITGFSSLVLLLDSLRDIPAYKPFARGLNLASHEAEVKRLFALEPIASLAELGALFGAERRVRAIYRIRASCIDNEDEEGRAVVTIGYPIIIQEA